MANRRRKPKRKAGLGYFIIFFIILIVFAAAAVFVSRRFAPSKTYTDLNEYYNLTAYESSERAAAGSNELAIVIDDKILDSTDAEEFRAVKSDDGSVYVAASFVQDYIDGRFYVDENEGFVILTTATDSVIASIDSTVYNSQSEDHDAGYVIAKYIEGVVFINMEFVAEHSTVGYSVLSDPARLYITSESGTYDYCTATSSIRMRTGADKQRAIVTDIEKGSRLKVLSKADGWLQVVDDRGYVGYVQDNFVSEITSETLTSDYVDPEYTHITLDDSINMVWHGIYYYDSNYYLSDYTSEMTGVNVLAPTWFLFSDTDGNILSYASQDYIDYAHNNGWYVWAVLEDMDGVSSAEILPYTSKRLTAISQIMSECQTYGIDGINVDLEQVTSDMGDDFIQFIRELSAECRNNGIVLSVDDYAPYTYNAYRHTDEQSKIADYVAIMAYDDYVGGTEAGPNSGLPFMEEVLNLCTSTVDMSRLIVGLPFYTRVWYSYEDGTLDKETMDMGDVSDMIWNYDVTLEWNSDVGYDYGEFDNYNGATVKLWYENANSLKAKLELIKTYNVAGISSWRLGQETSDVWAVLAEYY